MSRKRLPTAIRARKILARFNDDELDALADEAAESVQLSTRDWFRRRLLLVAARNDGRLRKAPACKYLALWIQATKRSLLLAPGGVGDTPRRRRAFSRARQRRS